MNQHDIIQLLLIAGPQSPVEQVLGDLRELGQAVRSRAVHDEAQLRDSLKSEQWTLLLSFEGHSPLQTAEIRRILQECQQEAALIVLLPPNPSVTPAALLQQGVNDVVSWDERDRLAFSLSREMAWQRLQQKSRQLEVSLQALEKRQLAFLDKSSQALGFISEGRHLYCNPSYAACFGYATSAQLNDKPLTELVIEADRDNLNRLLSRPSSGEQRLILQGRREDGSVQALELQVSPGQYNGQVCLQLLVQAVNGNTEYARKLAQIESQDLLTHLHNSSYFLQALESAIGAAVREASHSTLLLVQLNEFIDIAASLGRARTNLILADIARFLQKSINKPFTAARLGAHEFGLLLYDENLEEAAALAGFIQGKINQRIAALALPNVQLNCSVGMAAINAHAHTAENIIARARANPYPGPAQDKHVQGTDTPPGLNDIVYQLEQALDQGRLKLLFQPVVNLKGEAPSAYEVLTRLQDENGQELEPAQFIPVANIHGLGERLDREVVQRVLQLLDANKPAKTALLLNLTHNALISKTFLPWLSEQLQIYRSPTDLLAFKISEIDLSRWPEQVLEFCRGLEELNLGRVITHFGFALDSFRNLTQLRPQYVTLDETLLQDIIYSREQTRNLRTMVADLHTQGYLVAAPRVEDMNMLGVLCEAGVDLVQGYCLQKPSQEMNYEFIQEQEITLAAIQS